MPSPLARTLELTLLPVFGMAAGGFIAGLWPPSPRMRSYIQHLAAGVVFSAVAVELLPDVMHRKEPLGAAIGFSLGVVLMVALRGLAHRFEREEGAAGGAVGGRSSWSLVAVVGIDVFVDGILIGVILATGKPAGFLVSVALALELFSLGLATSAAVGARGASRPRATMTTSLLALVPAVGSLIGGLALARLGGETMEGILAFAAAALLYLVAEELLVEAHEVPETPLSTSLFFVGFLALLLVDMMSLS